MPTIASVESACYRVPLPVVLSDSTHGEMTHFELVTARWRDSDGAEGLGYTYTVGTNGAAIHVLIERYLRPLLVGAEADRIEPLWQKMWWALHYGGRGGPVVLAISALDIALWISPRSAAGSRCGGCSADSTRACRATRAASTSSFRSTGCSSRPTISRRTASARSR